MESLQNEISDLCLCAGFIKTAFTYYNDAPLVICALPYCNTSAANAGTASAGSAYATGDGGFVTIAPFARFNHYKEAVRRLQGVVKKLHEKYGDAFTKKNCRIFCNSRLSEKELAVKSGLGFRGKNSLVLTREAGSRFALAGIVFPPTCPTTADIKTEQRSSVSPGNFPLCGNCSSCVDSCPTGALKGDGAVCLERCIQWYASGNGGTVPEPVAAKWGDTLYGCTKCQDCCPYNRTALQGVETALGALPARIPAAKILAMSDEQLRAFFKGTTLDAAWLTPTTLRRNASLACHAQIFCERFSY
jgi:epoxyqueuosine reductase